MNNTTMNATINFKSTCNPRKVYEINRDINRNGITERDARLYFNTDGSFKSKVLVGEIEKANILALKELGYTDLKVATEMSRSLSTIYKVKKEAGKVNSRKKKPNDTAKLMRRMRRRGIAVKEIADIFGVCPATVYNHTKGINSKVVRFYKVV